METNRNKIVKFLISFVLFVTTIVFFVMSVIMKRFGGTIYDSIVYLLACVFFLMISIWAVRLISAEKIIDAIKHEAFFRTIIQVVCFSVISFMTLYYYNSASEYGHSVSMEVITSAFLIILLSLHTREELMHPLTQWSTMVAMLACLGKGIYKHYTDYRVVVLFTNERIKICLITTVLAATIVTIIKKVKRGYPSTTGFLLIGFFVLQLIFLNTRKWPVITILLFMLLYLRPEGRQDSLDIVKNYIWGVILAFWFIFLTAILCRPYYSFEFTRYPSWFSSVASAGLFWIICYICALTALLAKWKPGKGSIKENIARCFFELVTVGAVLTHLMMSMSRTSVLTVGVVSVVAFVAAELVRFRDNIKEIAIKCVCVILAFITIFPIVYTLTRCVPAMVGLPFRVTRAEWFSDQIEVGESWSSSKYMNIAQYGETLMDKMFGIDINLSEMAGAYSGPDVILDENGEEVVPDNVVGTFEKDGVVQTMKDYTYINESDGEESNGRIDILKEYYARLNFTGHDTMQIEEVGDKLQAYHAHNTYMQIAYDHGIVTGIVFAGLVGFAIISSLVYYKKNGKNNGFSIYSICVFLGFAIAGLTEWIFHPSIPLGFGFLIGFVPLFCKSNRN